MHPRPRLLLFGRPTLLGPDGPVKLRRKGLALLAILAERGRPCPRTWLSELLWGDDGLPNLRQELRALRRLPHAEAWLVVDDGWVQAQMPSDLADARQAYASSDLAGLRACLARGPLLEGFEQLAGEGFEQWLDDVSAEVEAWLPSPQAPAQVAEALIADVLSIAPPRCAPDDAVAAWLGLPLWQVVATRSQLQASGVLDARGRWQGRGRSVGAHLAAHVVRYALAHGDLGEDLLAAVHACADDDLAATWWLRRAEGGRRDAADRALALAPPGLWAAACTRAAELAVRAQDLPSARRHTEALSAYAVDTQAPTALFEAALLRGRLRIAEGSIPSARSSLEEARDVARKHGGPDALARVDALEGQVLATLGERQRARPLLTRAAASNHAHSRATALIGLGMLAAVDGRFEEAAQLHDDALTATRSLGDRDASARVLNNLGASAERMGWLERAERCFTDAIELADRLEDNALAGIARVNLAEVLRRQGALGRSRRTLAEAFDRLESSPTVPPQACQVRADLELSCGRTEEAAAWFERAATAWDALGRRDAKMARWMADLAGGAPLETLHAAVDGLPLPAQRDLARLELAMRCDDTATLDALLGALAEPSAAPSALLRAKLAPQSPEAATQVASLPATGPLPAAALRLLAACADHLPQASERLDGALDAATEGLLPSQAEALRGSVVTLRRRPCPAPR